MIQAGSLVASYVIWDLWIISWVLAAVWTRRTAARPADIDQLVHLIPTLIGGGLLFFGSRVRIGADYHVIGQVPLWMLPEPAGWIVTGVCAAGLAFTWWARIWLGSLWSGSVGRKEGHAVVETGPYRLVRHPIYTGLIVAAFALAIQIGMLANLIGAALMSFGFWLKARLEERFLSQELGEGAYAEYRRRTPMLIPFWPVRG